MVLGHPLSSELLSMSDKSPNKIKMYLRRRTSGETWWIYSESKKAMMRTRAYFELAVGPLRTGGSESQVAAAGRHALLQRSKLYHVAVLCCRDCASQNLDRNLSSFRAVAPIEWFLVLSSIGASK